MRGGEEKEEEEEWGGCVKEWRKRQMCVCSDRRKDELTQDDRKSNIVSFPPLPSSIPWASSSPSFSSDPSSRFILSRVTSFLLSSFRVRSDSSQCATHLLVITSPYTSSALLLLYFFFHYFLVTSGTSQKT